MTEKMHSPEDLFDRAVAAVRDEPVDPETIEDARRTVWARLAEETASSERIEGCDDVQALLPAYLEGRLPEPRRVLVEQHTRECVACRRALMTQRTRSTAGETAEAKPAPAARTRRVSMPSWMPLAAVLALAAFGLGLLFWSGVLGPAQVMAEVDGLDGDLWKVDESGMLAAWSPGDTIHEGAILRTSKSSGAVVRLTDGSRIEMSERAELTLDKGWRGTTIRLDRGQVMVEAAKQHDGKLYVATDECLVSVVGTVFSVNHGLKGSRVSVLEGEVHVAQRGETDVLLPGDQVTTNAALGRVPLDEEISWSRDRERYRALLGELQTIRRELDERLPKPDQRFASRLLDLAPADTVGYAAVPNLGEHVGETWNVIRERVAASPVLAEWWQEAVTDEGMEPHLEELVTRVRDLGSFLGEEIVLSIAASSEQDGAPLILAEVVDGGLRAYLQAEIERLEAEHGESPLVLVDDPAAIPQGGEDERFLVWIGDGVLLATPSAQSLTATAAVVQGTAPAAFPGTSFHQRLAAVYADGVEWLFAADVSRVLAAEGDLDDPDLQATGFADLQHVVIERHRDDDQTRTRALVAFSGPRRGVASWLAAPAPMGTLDYVSSNAVMMSAFVIRDPASLLEELMSSNAKIEQGAADVFSEASSKLGVDLRRDVIDALGGEIAFAVDGPLVPEPAWKVIVEVYDSTGLQAAIETLVERAAAEMQGEGATVTLTPGELRGHPAYDVAVTGPNGGGVEISYLYADGYLIAAPSRALLDRALQVASSGTNITTAARFRALLPDNGEVHFSGLAFQDLASALGGGDDVSGALPEEYSENEVQALMDTVRNAPPMLGYAYGREDAIEIAATSGDSGLLSFGLWNGLAQGLAAAGGAP